MCRRFAHLHEAIEASINAHEGNREQHVHSQACAGTPQPHIRHTSCQPARIKSSFRCMCVCVCVCVHTSMSHRVFPSSSRACSLHSTQMITTLNLYDCALAHTHTHTHTHTCALCVHTVESAREQKNHLQIDSIQHTISQGLLFVDLQGPRCGHAFENTHSGKSCSSMQVLMHISEPNCFTAAFGVAAMCRDCCLGAFAAHTLQQQPSVSHTTGCGHGWSQGLERQQKPLYNRKGVTLVTVSSGMDHWFRVLQDLAMPALDKP
jgi:hypothetical protein